MEKVLFIWDYFAPTFKVPNEMKKYVLECRQDGEGMVIFLGGEFPSWIFTRFCRSRSRKVGFTYLIILLSKPWPSSINSSRPLILP
jgi:hypothetical protein